MPDQVLSVTSFIGVELSHYRILEEIGGGGMGVVYRARDAHLDREVAVKVLSPGTITDEAARKRLRKEALTLSKLNHPNIATVYDFDTQRGVDFLVMEYIPGITLSERLAAGPLPEKEVVRLGVQLSDGLAAAHERGVVHRDLKPGNLRLTSDGRLKILDFGIAKLWRPLTETAATESSLRSHSISGTFPYMAPEQLAGEEADARTDIHGAGFVLYEMATGQRPFAEVQSGQLLGALMRKAPVPPTTLNPKVSAELERIIGKCVEKEPENRYQSAKELAIDLRRLGAPSTVAAPVQKRERQSPKLILVAGALFVAVFVTLFTLNVNGWRDRLFGKTATPRIGSLAVLPLENLSGDSGQEYFADGMTEALITTLSQISALKVTSRTSVMHYKGTRKTVPQIAQELHVDAVLEGSVMRDANHLRVTAQLIHAPTDTHLWAESYERDLRDILAVQNEVAHAITSEINVKLTAQEQERLARTHPVNFAAHDAYFKARFHLQQGTEDQLREAKAYFEEAARIDSNYAPAYAGLADYYLLTDELSPQLAMPKAKEYVQKALALDDRLADAHVTLASIKSYGDWDWPGADKEFERAVKLSPSYAEAHRRYADFLSEMGRHDQALGEIRTAQELDPLSASTILDAGWAFYYGRKYNLAIEQCNKVLDLDPRSVSARDCIGSAHLATAAYDQAIAEYSAMLTSSGNDPVRLASLGCAYALAGKKLQAQKVVVQLNEASKIHYVPPYVLGLVHAALGENDKAFSWLEKAYEQHDSYLVRLRVEPLMDPLRPDPRFERLLHRMNL
ncbi:MAG TPA: protein kinase [Candidatus Sulfotelmatobacter sp.]|nr:protein kinase [Candidatus Sulfotelmatobacter sp.]